MNASFRLIEIVLVNILFIGMILAGGCSQDNAQDEVQNNNIQNSLSAGTKTAKGVTLSPKSFQQDDFIEFFEKAKQAGIIISWAGDWDELSDTIRGGPTVVASLAATYDYTPLIEAQFFTQSTGKLLRQLDETTKQKYLDNVVAFVEKYEPEYFGVGIEVNILYEKSPEDFEAFVQFYDDVYNAVKLRSPKTKVFTIFQLEKMKGLGGGLFGGKNDPSKAQWFLLERFPNSDLIAFTTYPGLIYEKPSEISPDYYLEIKSHTTKPVAFTEIGWHSSANITGWASSEEEQAEFIELFFDITGGLNTEFVIWSFMYDQNTIEPFNSMGLLGRDGKSKKAWSAWVLELNTKQKKDREQEGDFSVIYHYTTEGTYFNAELIGSTIIYTYADSEVIKEKCAQWTLQTPCWTEQDLKTIRAQLSSNEINDLRSLVEETKIMELDKYYGPEGGARCYSYTLKINFGGAEKEIVYCSRPDGISPLDAFVRVSGKIEEMVAERFSNT